jgi:hypothetical protein
MQASEALRHQDHAALLSQVQRLQNVVQVKDACIKNYTNFIKQLQAPKPHTHRNIERHSVSACVQLLHD